MRNDTQIRNKILELIKLNAKHAIEEIRITVKDGLVSISGKVDNYQEKWTIEKCAYLITGVREVLSELAVAHKMPCIIYEHPPSSFDVSSLSNSTLDVMAITSPVRVRKARQNIQNAPSLSQI